MFHNFECFNQTCDGQETGVCGSTKMRALFAGILATMGTRTVEYFEHVQTTYIKSDLKKVPFEYITIELLYEINHSNEFINETGDTKLYLPLTCLV